MKVAVVGLGRIGLPTAVLCALRGHDVVGVDRDDDVRNCIAWRDLPYDEPGLESELGRIDVVPTIEDTDAEVWIVAAGTTHEGALDATGVHAIVRAIAARPACELVIIESTVPPGTCAAIAVAGLPVAHCPERARPGQVFEDIATIPRLCGGIDEATTRRAVAFYQTLTDAPIIACRAIEAELSKLAENAEREVRIAFANEVADVAVSFEVDPQRLIELANSHPRTDMLQPGIGVGGHCLPMATRWFATRSDGVAARARAMHDRRPAEIAARITKNLAPRAHICVLGRTYRPDTRYHQRADGLDIYGSPAVALIAELERLGFEVTSWDPSDDEDRATAEAGADLVFVAVPHAQIPRFSR